MNPEEKLDSSDEEAWKRDERSWGQILKHFEGLSDKEIAQVTCFQFAANWWDEQRCQRVTLRQSLREGQVNSLVTVLNKMHQLQHLNVSGNFIGNLGAVALASAAVKMPQLQHLDVSGNWIGVKGAEALAKAKMPNLQHLNVEYNRIGVQGAEALAAAKMPQLRHLDVRYNKIGVQGAEALAAAKMPQLQHLDVRYNKIGVQGAEALAAAAAKMPQLQRLHVSRHEIGDQGVQAFAKATLLCPRVWDVVDFNRKSDFKLCELLEAELPPRLAGKDDDEVLEYLHCRIGAQAFLSCYEFAEKRRLKKDIAPGQLVGMDTFSRSSIHEPKLVPLILAYLKGSTKPTGH